MLFGAIVGLPLAGFARPQVVIATGELPPYVSENPRESMLTDLFNEIGREMGVKFVFRFEPWKRCEQALKNQDAWGAIPYVQTPDRLASFYFSDRLFDRKALLFAYWPKATPKAFSFKDLGDLRGYILGGVRGYYYEQRLRNAGLDVEYVTVCSQNFLKLKAGRIDLLIADEPEGEYLARKLFPQEAGNFHALPKPLDTTPDYLMASKQYPSSRDLLSRFNAALYRIKTNGAYQRILQAHGMESLE